MMKLYADLFALTEESISAKSIKRLRWLTIGSLPILPLAAFVKIFGFTSLKGFGPLSGYIVIFLITLFAFSLTCAVPVILSRIGNRIWAPDKYLDEWEQDMKRKSMAMAFIVVMWVTGAMGLSLSLFYKFIVPLVSEDPTALPFLMVLSILGAGIYTLIFTQLSLIDPIDEDELEGPKYVVTSARSILGIIVLFIFGSLFAIVIAGAIHGYASHDDDHHAAAKETCGDVDVDTHKLKDAAIEVKCEGSDSVIRLDPETLKPIQ